MGAAERKIRRLEDKKTKLLALVASSKDSVEKAKVKKQVTGLQGAIKATKATLKKSNKTVKADTLRQKKEIADVVKGVVLSKDKGKSASAQATKEAAVATAKKSIKP